METNLVRSILTLTGVNITPDKFYLLESRLNDVMDEYGFKTFDEASYHLENGRDSDFAESVIEKITTHETRFFREETVFDALVLQIIPEWMEKNKITILNPGNCQMEIWSAGCSTGQEPYSIAIAIAEKFPSLAKNISILATDISGPTLTRAERGVFSKFDVERGMPPHLLRKYFHEVNSEYQICDEIKQMVRFQRHNLISSPAPGAFNAIFCRNVCIYFQDHVRKSVYEILCSSLRPDGSLVLGSVESLHGFVSNYIVRECGLARYFEINSSSVTMFQ